MNDNMKPETVEQEILEQILFETMTAEAKRLKNQLLHKSQRVVEKYSYYDADNSIIDFGISLPAKMLHSRPGIGWAARAVSTVSDRLTFDGFANDTIGINKIFDNIGATATIDRVKNDAIIGGCAFVAIAQDSENEYGVSLVPFTAMEATGIVDQRTGLLKMGLAVTRWKSLKKHANINTTKNVNGYEPADYILFTPDYTATFVEQSLCDIKKNNTRRCLLHPITRKSSANKPLGRSKLNNTVRRIIQEVARLKRRYEIASEFYSTPQRYMNGLAEGAQKDANIDSVLGKVWAVTKDEDGDKPDIGQLPQMSISQFSDQKKDLARDFCAETSLVLRNLGYETNNPTSADSLSAMSDDLLLEVKACQTEMGRQIKELAISVYMSVHDISSIPSKSRDLIPAWLPIFQLDIGSAGDAVYKLFQAMPELIGTVQSYQMLGIDIRQAEKLAEMRQQSNSLIRGGLQNG